MMFLKSLFSVSFLVFSATNVYAKDDYVRGEDPAADAMYDMNKGIAGMQQAAKDPQLLAQLMQDMKDPEMMAEAKKMMDNPEFKKQMKQFEKSKEFKDATKNTKQMMEDPSTVARVQAQMEHMLQRGQDTMKKNARGSMQEAMTAMNDPLVMTEAAAMMKDPQFQQKMSQMAKDPAFQNYIKAMQDMMQDPTQREQIEKVSAKLKQSM